MMDKSGMKVERITDLKFNLKLNMENLKRCYSEENKVRIDDFLLLDAAEEIARIVQAQVVFSTAYNLEGKNREASEKELLKLPKNKQRQLMQSIYAEAAKGRGFLYGRHALDSCNTDSHPVLLKVLKFMNSSKMIEFVRHVAGNQSIQGASAQVTRFTPGNFLTRHRDDVLNETRQIAYVIGLSPQWHPDWGGLLQFFTETGNPATSLSPKFNSLSLFDVHLIHSVTSVSAFSPKNRYSITGWFFQ